MSTITTPITKNQTLHVSILSPERTVFDGQALAISTYNDVGPFDILPFHANLITMIKNSITVYHPEKKTEKIPCDKGILKVFENTVVIFLGIETITSLTGAENKGTKSA